MPLLLCRCCPVAAVVPLLICRSAAAALPPLLLFPMTILNACVCERLGAQGRMARAENKPIHPDEQGQACSQVWPQDTQVGAFYAMLSSGMGTGIHKGA